MNWSWKRFHDVEGGSQGSWKQRERQRSLWSQQRSQKSRRGPILWPPTNHREKETKTQGFNANFLSTAGGISPLFPNTSCVLKEHDAVSLPRNIQLVHCGLNFYVNKSSRRLTSSLKNSLKKESLNILAPFLMPLLGWSVTYNNVPLEYKKVEHPCA